MANWESRDNNRCLNKPFNMAPNFALFLVMHLSILIYSRFLNMPPVTGALQVTCQKSHGCSGTVTWEWGHMGTLHGNTSHGLVNKNSLIEFHNLMCIIFQIYKNKKRLSLEFNSRMIFVSNESSDKFLKSRKSVKVQKSTHS